MSSRRTVARAVLSAFSVAAFSGSPAAETSIFRRVIPTDVSWGEISIAHGGAVKLVLRKEPVEFPLTLSIVCDRRERREDLSDANGQAAATPSERWGAVYLGAELAGGKEAWRDAADKLRERVGKLTPETFGTFARTFTTALTGADSPIAGDFRVVACLSGRGESDQAWEVRRWTKDGAISAGSTGFTDSRPICSALTGALEGEAPAAVLASRLDVRTQREQELTYVGLPTPSPERAPWPAGASVTIAPAPVGTTSYSSSGGGDGGVFYDVLRAGGDKPYVVKATAKPATIPRDDLDKDVLLTLWTWRVSDVTLGADPSTSDAATTILAVAFIFPETHGGLGADEMVQAVARDFASSDKAPGLPLLEALIQLHAHELGTDKMFAVFCDTTKPREATYCVSRACEPVVNAEEFCDALSSKFESITRGPR